MPTYPLLMPTWVLALSYWLHLIATIVWVGGLALMALVVWPAAGFPLMAKRNGAALVIINREPTDFDDAADLVVRQDIGAVLEPFIAA